MNRYLLLVFEQHLFIVVLLILYQLQLHGVFVY